MVMKTDIVVCFCLPFLRWPWTKLNSCLLVTLKLTFQQKRFDYVIVHSVWAQNKRLCTRVWTFNINLDNFCSYHCARFSDLCRTYRVCITCYEACGLSWIFRSSMLLFSIEELQTSLLGTKQSVRFTSV